jgi:Raf kinase inhibitor-like YbhB/YbcL family protein
MLKKMMIVIIIFLSAAVVFAAGERKKKMKVTSPAFKHEALIPAKYTCDGANVSPEISWSGAPENTKSYVIICDDPDAPAGTWVHWVVYDIDPAVTKLAEDMEKGYEVKGVAKQGVTSFIAPGYGGPCPPSGTHRYYFKVYALDIATLGLDPKKSSKKEVLAEMQVHVIGQGELMGKYARAK